MVRKFVMAAFLNTAAIVVLGGLGCGRKEPTANPPVDSAESPKIEPPASPPVKAETQPSTTAPSQPQQSEAAAVPAGSSPLRDLLSRYLENDAKGIWRKNEQVATDLEKLTDEEITQIWPLLKDRDANVRRGAAVFLLGVFVPTNRDQVTAFAALLDDSDAMVRARGLDGVKQFEPADQAGVLSGLAALLDANREERVENRISVARLCGTLKREAAAALPALKQAASADGDARVRAAAIAAVAVVAEPKEAAGALAISLNDKDAGVRLAAVARLRQLGVAASPAVQPLAAALADPNKDVAEAAAEALIRVGPEAVSVLAEQLASTNLTSRKFALACLAKLGPLAKPATEQIEKCRKDANPEVRQLAEAALRRISSP